MIAQYTNMQTTPLLAKGKTVNVNTWLNKDRTNIDGVIITFCCIKKSNFMLDRFIYYSVMYNTKYKTIHKIT